MILFIVFRFSYGCIGLSFTKKEDINLKSSLVRTALFRVELEGFEPSSEQGNHMLSTRLFQPLVFEQQQDLDHQLMPYPLKFHTCIEAYLCYFRFYVRHLIFRFGTLPSE